MKTRYIPYKIRNWVASSFLLFAFSFFSTSCKKLVEVPAPTNSLVTTDIFNSDATAISAQLNVYAYLEKSLVATNDLVSGLSSDEFTNYSTQQLRIDFYKNTLSAQ